MSVRVVLDLVDQLHEHESSELVSQQNGAMQVFGSQCQPRSALLDRYLARDLKTTNVKRRWILLSATVRMNMWSVWNFGSVSAVLFTTTPLYGELRPRLATQIGHQSLNGTCAVLCSVLAASVGVSGVRSDFRVFASPEIPSCPAWSASAIARRSPAEAFRASFLLFPSLS